jgi:hypothetical protein
MEYEQQISNNIINFYNNASKNKITFENINNYNFSIPSKQYNSIILWNNFNNIINFNDKFNHLFLYNCNNLILRNIDCVSGITIINCNNCKILFKTVPFYNIEISNSFNIILRSFMFSLPLLFKNCSVMLLKYVNYNVPEYIKIDDGFFSRWNCEFFNF